MADLSLADALTEPSPEIEEEIKRDFIATLEAEAFDDVVGETVGKTDYIPLLDVDEKTGSSESKKKPCSDTRQVEGTPSSQATVLANGDHGIERNDVTGFPTEFLEEKMAYQGYQNSQNWPENTNFCFEPEQMVNPIQTGMLPCDTFAPAAVVPQGWSAEAPNPAHLESFISPEAVPQPLQPTAEPAEKVEMASGEERAPAESLEMMVNLQAADMVPSREAEMVPAKDVVPATETEVALAKDVESPTKPDEALVKDVESSIKSDMALVKDTVSLPETEMALGRNVALPPETEVTLAKDVAQPPETDVNLANNAALAKFSEAEVVPVPVKDMETARTQEATSEDSQLKSLQDEGQSAVPPLMTSPEAVVAMGQKHSLPTDEDSVLEELEQKKPSSQTSELPSETSGIAKPEEGQPTGSVSGNDITAPPNKELPPSPEKKTKPLATTQPAKTSTSKAKTQPTSLPKQTAPTTFGGSNKKPMSLASGSVPAAPPKRPAAATARPSTLPSKDTKPKPVAEAKIPEKRVSPSKPASAPAVKPGSKSTQAAPKAPATAALASPGSTSRNLSTPLPIQAP